jgi:hypothetical protein
LVRWGLMLQCAGRSCGELVYNKFGRGRRGCVGCGPVLVDVAREAEFCGAIRKPIIEVFSARTPAFGGGIAARCDSLISCKTRFSFGR